MCDTAQVVINVDVTCTEDIFIPNGISPNNDGKYDTWEIPTLFSCFPDNEVIIFNRWGDIVYQNTGYGDTDNIWDGTWQQNGNELPDGTYYYIITLSPSSGKKLNGFIELRR